VRRNATRIVCWLVCECAGHATPSLTRAQSAPDRGAQNAASIWVRRNTCAYPPTTGHDPTPGQRPATSSGSVARHCHARIRSLKRHDDGSIAGRACKWTSDKANPIASVPRRSCRFVLRMVTTTHSCLGNRVVEGKRCVEVSRQRIGRPGDRKANENCCRATPSRLLWDHWQIATPARLSRYVRCAEYSAA
jgi:hypothetical protein